MKHNKLFAMLALAASLALVACNNDAKTSSKHTHKFGEPTVIKAATCTEAGTQKVKCTECGEEVEQPIRAKGHTWGELEDIPEEMPTCTEAGNKKHKCTVCQVEEKVPVDALGHVYAQDEEGNDIVVWSTEATCEHAGAGEKECTRCHEKEQVTAEQLQHNFQLTAEPTDPEPGKATVRTYHCDKGCDKTRMGFRASEVTAESKEHLVIDEETGGARFWGRPIGNDVELNESGDPSESSHEAVFNDQQQGDFFEYLFDLDETQAAALANCYLICEATPAQWMRENNMDFFACKPGDTDWTRGMYIDDIAETPEDEKGSDISDYRYILYVDGQPKAFDDSITNPVTSSSKGNYKLPYLFHLHKGENRISLRMAGGYRSTFFNFTFETAQVA